MRVPFVVVACLLFATIARADTIGTSPLPPSFTMSGFGSSEPYRGEIIRIDAGGDVLADSLTVFVGPTSDLGAGFHLLLTDVTMTGGFHPTTVLFESDTLEVPLFPLRRDPDMFVVDLGGLRLSSNHDYAWLIDYFVVGDPAGFVSMGTGLGDYTGGVAVRFPTGLFPGGTRDDHFAGTWFMVPDFQPDFAFALTYHDAPVDAPEPAITLLLSVGLVAAGARARSRRA